MTEISKTPKKDFTTKILFRGLKYPKSPKKGAKYLNTETQALYMVTRSAAPLPPPPPWSMVQDGPPPVGGSLFPLWGGCGGFGVLGLA